jgi:N-methylhydantoinase B/oxoprolinase/acetone carboxylase alpha subunit
MQTAINILTTIVVLIIVIFVLNLLNKAAEYLEKKATAAGNSNLASLISMADSAITQAVEYVNQTYVDALKAAGNFDKEAQVAAYNKAVSAAMDLITEDGAQAITEIFGNIQEYLNTKIEATVRELKKKDS